MSEVDRREVDVHNMVVVDGVLRRVKPAGLSMEDYHEKLTSKGLYEDGTEAPDPTPEEPPIGYIRQPSMVEHIRNLIRSEQLRMAAEEQGVETFEEADDFDVPDELEPISGYEMEDSFDPPIQPKADPEPPAEAAGGVKAPEPEGHAEHGGLDAKAGDSATK